MAWFGEGFSSLKGQITNFTKEIVTNNIISTEDTDEKDNSEKNKKLNAHIQQLEAHCKDQDDEINKLRLENLQLRKMFTDGGTRDRLHSEEATFECDTLGLVNVNIPLSSWEEEVAEPFLGQDNAPDPASNTQKLPKDTKLDEELISLRSRLRKTFQEKVLLEQSCSRLEKDVSLLSQQVNKSKQQMVQAEEEAARRNAEMNANTGITARQHQATQTGDASGSSNQNCHCMTPELSSLLEENDRLKEERVQMRQEMTAMARVVQDLESQVAVSQDENSNLSTGLEELDIRHQQEIEQIMNLKDSTQKRYDSLVAEFEEMKNKYEEVTKDSCKKEVVLCAIETQTLESVEDIEKSFNKKLADEIESLLKFPIPPKFFESNETSECCTGKFAALVNYCIHLKETVDSFRLKERQLVEEIKVSDEDLQVLEIENTTLREKLEQLSKKDNLPPIFENFEEVEVLEHKCAALENENHILIEVRCNLETDLNKSRTQIDLLVQKLGDAEAKVKNYTNLQTEVSKYKDIDAELRNKISDMITEKEEMLLNIGELQNQISLLKMENDAIKIDKNRLLEETKLNEGLREELCKFKSVEIEIQKVKAELETEKSLRLGVEAEKEKLFNENFKLDEEIQIKNNIILELEQDISKKTCVEDEKIHLLNEVVRLEEIEKHCGEVKEALKQEQIINKQLKDEKEKLVTEVKKLEEAEKLLKQSLEQSDAASDLKLKSLSQKFKNMESQFLDLSEKADSLKVESDSKDRKLCQVFLEKSVLEKELEKLQINNCQILEEISKVKESEKDAYQFLERNHIATVEDLQKKIIELENEKSLHLKEKEKFISELNNTKDQMSSLKNNVDILHSTTTSEVQAPEDTNHETKSFEAIPNSSIDDSLHFQEELTKLHEEKDQLIQTLQAKHLENVQYHGEIQRLNTLLSAQLSKTEQAISSCSSLTKVNLELQQKLEAKDVILTNLQTASDKKISTLKQQVETLQNQLEYVSQLLRVADRQEAEGQPASDSPSMKVTNKSFLTEVDSSYNIEELLENLKQEQLRNKYLQNEVQEQHEKEQGSLKEIERLRIHLVNVEENYTQELVRAEEQIKELQMRLNQADERVKSSSTAYTSASIRANQQVESLGKQVRLLSEQKEKLLAQIATAEDKLHKQAAALTNLQIVLEQFQKDKERDISIETERIKGTLQLAENKNADLLGEIKSLQMQLKEAKEGLSAASRLNEQLDRKSQTITELKQKVTELTEYLTRAEERVHAASLSVEGKVDRCLVRNLIVGYFCAPSSSRQQALSIVATVLDLSQEDRQKVGLEPNSKTDDHRQQSLSEAFVRFLENESRPQAHLKLSLVESDKESRSRKTSLSEVGLPNARRTSGSVLKDVLKQDSFL